MFAVMDPDLFQWLTLIGIGAILAILVLELLLRRR